MKILALNSSARVGDVSKTEIMLDCLVQGMREAGAEVEVINLQKKKIRKPAESALMRYISIPTVSKKENSNTGGT